MTSKKQLEKKVTEQGFEIDELNTELAEKEECIRNQAKMMVELREQANMKQTIFLVANVDQYPTREGKDEVLDHLRERNDNELNRLGIPAETIVLPDIVKTIFVHEMKV